MGIKMMIKTIQQRFLHNVNVKKLKLGDENEVAKFRINFYKLFMEIQKAKPEKKKKLLSGLKAGAFQLIATIPVVTPIVTAFFQAYTAEDLGSKIDELGSKIDELGSKIDGLGSKIDGLGSKIDNLKSVMLGILTEILTTLKERLPIPQKQ